MSYALSAAILKMKFTATEKALLHAILDHVGDSGGDCWASFETLAYESGTSMRQVRRTVRDLEQRGILSTVGSRSASGRHRTTRYRFLTPEACRDILAAIKAASEQKQRNADRMAEFVQEVQELGQGGRVTGNADTLARNADKVSQNADKVSDESVKNLSLESVKDGRTVSTPVRSLEQSRAVLRRIAEAWRTYWTETLPGKWPRVHKVSLQEWAERAEKFQQFTDADYKLLDGLLAHETEAELLARWSAFIEMKDNDGGDGWDEVKFPFRIFARQ